MAPCRRGWRATTAALLSLAFALVTLAGCVSGQTPDCSSPDAGCGPSFSEGGPPPGDGGDATTTDTGADVPVIDSPPDSPVDSPPDGTSDANADVATD